MQGLDIRGIPVLRTEGAFKNTDQFLSEEDLPSWCEIVSDGSSVRTSALKMSKGVNLLDISQTEDLVKRQVLTLTDALSPDVMIDRVVMKTTKDEHGHVFVIGVTGCKGNTFKYYIGEGRRHHYLQLNFDFIESFDKVEAKVSVALSGIVFIDSGEMQMDPGVVFLESATNRDDGTPVSDETFDVLDSIIEDWEVIGFVPYFRRINSGLKS